MITAILSRNPLQVLSLICAVITQAVVWRMTLDPPRVEAGKPYKSTAAFILWKDIMTPIRVVKAEMERGGVKRDLLGSSILFAFIQHLVHPFCLVLHHQEGNMEQASMDDSDQVNFESSLPLLYFVTLGR